MYNTRVNPEISNELRVMIRQGGLILEETVPPETEHAACGAGQGCAGNVALPPALS